MARETPGEKHSGKNKIQAAARRLFSSRGFHNVSVRDIAEEAGLSKSTVNHHYGSKERLWREMRQNIMITHANDLMALLRPKKEDEETAIDVLVSTLNAYFDSLQRNPDVVRFTIWSVAEGVDEIKEYPEVLSVDSLIMELYSSRLQMLKEAGVIHDSVDPHLLTSVVASAAFGWIALAKFWAQIAGLEDAPPEWDAGYRKQVEVMIRALAKKEGPGQGNSADRASGA